MVKNICVSGIMKADGSGDKKTLPNGQGNHHRKSSPLQKSMSTVLPAITPSSRYGQYSIFSCFSFESAHLKCHFVFEPVSFIGQSKILTTETLLEMVSINDLNLLILAHG